MVEEENINKEDEWTSISITKATRDRMKDFKLTSRETNEEQINRLLAKEEKTE